MSTVAGIITGVQKRIETGKTIGAATDPSLGDCYQWINETALWLTGVCAENESDLGRTIGTFTTVHAAITGATQAADCQITATAHGLMASGDVEAVIKGVGGMTELNDKEYTATYASANAVTLGVSSAAYSAYTSGGYIGKRIYPDLATSIYAPAQRGWLVKDHDRSEITLATEDALIGYDPVEMVEPSEFYIDGENNVCFPSYPDAAYVVKIPHWKIPTAVTAITDPMPFLGLMDNVFIEAVAIRAQNRDEYDLSFELKWFSFVKERAERVIAMRKKMRSGVEK